MTPALLAVLTGAALTLLAVLGAAVAVVNHHRRTQRALAASLDEVTRLRARLEELEAARDAVSPAAQPAQYVITTAGEAGPLRADGAVAEREPTVSDRVVLSGTLGEPLVRVVSLLYGVSRALSAESRNRIAFEMRREVKRARKQRRRETRQARRAWQAAQRAETGEEDAA